METHQKLLSRLGGKDVVLPALAERGIEVKPDAFRKWRDNGIPFKYRPIIADIASKKRVAVPKDFLIPTAA